MRSDDMDFPTDVQIAEMGWAAIEAAIEKAKQMGLPWHVAVLGIDRAYRGTKMFVDLLSALGPEMVDALGEALRLKLTEEILKEAEEALND